MKAPKIWVVLGGERELLGWSFDEAEANSFRDATAEKWGDDPRAIVEECPPVGVVDVPCPADERERLKAEIELLTHNVKFEHDNYLKTHATLCVRNGEISALKRDQAALVRALGEKEPV